MKNVMMASRELRRVPLDFDAPIGETWKPLVEMPLELVLDPCPTCGPPTAALGGTYGTNQRGQTMGDGMTPEGRQLSETWYSHHVGGWGDDPLRSAVQWCDKLGQAEVDALIEAGRLNPTIDCPNGCKTPSQRGLRAPFESAEDWQTDCEECQGRGWTRKQLKPGDLTAKEVNEQSLRHDAINRWIVIKKRAELLGLEITCPTCEGDGAAGTDAQKKARGEWEPPKIPEGLGYQLWQTVSEGGPVSPVFKALETLAEWLESNEDIAGTTHTKTEWLELMGGKKLGIEIGSGQMV